MFFLALNFLFLGFLMYNMGAGKNSNHIPLLTPNALISTDQFVISSVPLCSTSVLTPAAHIALLPLSLTTLELGQISQDKGHGLPGCHVGPRLQMPAAS